MIGAGAAGSLRRISALTLRYWHLLWGSWPRMVELAYWPTVMMVLWGFMQEFLSRETGFFANAFGMLLGAVMLWDACFRGQLGVSISFFEEMWSRNLGHLLVSPLRPWEWVAALFAVSLARTILGMTPASLLSIWFFNFSIYSLGVMLAVFFLLLIAFGWAIGLLVSGLVLRQGLGAETLAWAVIFALAPFSCVYYPLDSLPAWMQAVALALPTTHVFEGMRALLANESVRGDALLSALALDALYLGAATWWFLESLAAARDKGALLQIGE